MRIRSQQIVLLATFAGATTVNFDSYTPLNTCMSSISTGGLDFNANVSCNGSYQYVWDSSSPSGTGYRLMDNVMYNASTTPEPGTLALLGSGMLAGLGVLRRKMLL